MEAGLAGLAWDLGAACVLLPPMPRDSLPDVVAGLMGVRPGREGDPPPKRFTTGDRGHSEGQ